MKWILLILMITFFGSGLIAQDVEISINNPSFEDIPHKGQPGSYIRGWYDCGLLQFKGETPPDIHPLLERRIKRSLTFQNRIHVDTVERGIWEVMSKPSEGNTFLGMVVRDNDTWESLSQRLKVPIEEGKCYSFSIDLARSDFYVSGSRLTEAIENYTQPSVLRIWGGTAVCGKQELLGESVTVENNQWRTYEFEFRPDRSVNFFTLEAFYKVPNLFAYNGHLLLDNASIIKEIPCDEEEINAPETEEIMAEVQESVNKPRQPVKAAPAPVTESLDVSDIIEEKPVVVSEPEVPKNLIPELQGKNFRTGQIIRINSIYFPADSETLNDQSIEAIEQIFDFLTNNKGIVIEVGGHTATVPRAGYCDQLSSARAKVVATYLARMGISPKRLYYKGYGKRKPIVPDDKYNMAARKKNQRVEIKILQTNYQEAG